jgi:cell fate regulator YaaT (PSP1 superfamily)
MTEETAPAEPATAYIVRHGAMRYLGVFSAPPTLELARGATVITGTDRGTEVGTVLGLATPQATKALPDPTRGEVLRVATEQDHKRIEELSLLQARQYDISTQLVKGHRLAMQIVDVELLFGGERLLFYFLAEHRVDFRDLVKSLAREFHTRIELRQIGPREEAKIKADYGDCGRPVCCNTFLVEMPQISMRMAKLQKSTLDPNKISGRCGRLKCCLRYEQDVYEVHQAELPGVGSRVVTTNGPGRVLAQEVLARRLLIEFEDGRRLPVPAVEVLSRIGGPGQDARGGKA